MKTNKRSKKKITKPTGLRFNSVREMMIYFKVSKKVLKEFDRLQAEEKITDNSDPLFWI